MFIGHNEIGVKATGETCHVPNRDVCKLSYYLRCATVTCGLDIIVDDLLDFKNAHLLPSAKQDAIFKFAYDDFDRQTMTNVTIFEDFDRDYLKDGRNNEFYELSQVQSLLAVQEEAIIGGKHTQVRKIMVFDRKWIEKNYEGPIRRNMDRIRRIMGSSVCPAIAGLIEALEEVEVSSSRSSSQRRAVHKRVTCDWCHDKPIRGIRYKCCECSNYDLCEKCYDKGKHNKSHRFKRIDRPGMTPVKLKPRSLWA